MNQIERRDNDMAYISDDAVFAQQAECRKILQQLNFMDRSDFDGIKKVAEKLLGKSDNPFINPPFYCDYGFHIEVGKDFFANYNCTIIDVAKVTIGDNCFLAPNVAIYTAGHPAHPDTRRSMYEYGKHRKGFGHWRGKRSDSRYSVMEYRGGQSLQSDQNHHRRRQK